MIRKIKHAFRKKNNSGSSFVLVIVATTFMCVLAASILMAALMTYKLKYYKLNSINNFYEVEKALDEIYAGVGASVNEHLYSAYTTTAELVVTYDTTNQVYTTLDNDTANELFKRLFMAGFVSDPSYSTLNGVSTTFGKFVSNPYSTSNESGVKLSLGSLELVYTDSNGYTSTLQYATSGGVTTEKPTKNPGFDENKIETITFKNICVTRSVALTGASAGTVGGTYQQSIMTDIVLSKPEYNVSLNTATNLSDSLYDYAILADMGVEITSPQTSTDTTVTGTSVTINGNMYVASDYYNKSYNGDADTKVTTKYDTEASIQWGSTENSYYSGLFVDGENTSLALNADLIVCSGTLAAYNGASINLMGRTQNKAELWTDNIVIGGSVKGGSIIASANAYVYDDTELNAEESQLTFNAGRYFGYSYDAVDTRDISFLKEKGLATNFELKSHFSDSAIIVNGKDSKLDLEKLTSLYIAGKSYIDFSRTSKVSDDDDTISYEFKHATDYATGQALDIKSNQLIFLNILDIDNPTPDSEGKITLKIPDWMRAYNQDTAVWKLATMLQSGVATQAKPAYAIKQTVSGHDYYYLYIENEELAKEFAMAYYNAIEETNGKQDKLYNVRRYTDFEVELLLPEDDSKIAADGLITDQYTVTEKGADRDDWLYFRNNLNSDGHTINLTLDVNKALESVATEKTFATLLGKGVLLGNSDAVDALDSIKTEASENAKYNTSDNNKASSMLLDYMYINLKDHLSVCDDTVGTGAAETNISAWEKAHYRKSGTTYTYNEIASGGSTTTTTDKRYSFDYSLTPLNSYVDYNYIFNKHMNMDETISGAGRVIVNQGDVKVNDDGSHAFKGIIIAAGDVTFDSGIKSFTGIIITGGKVKIDHSMTFSADNIMVATLLAKCAESSDKKLNMLTTKVTGETSRVLKKYKESTGSNSGDSGVSISDINYEDILTFENWKKNVE